MRFKQWLEMDRIMDFDPEDAIGRYTQMQAEQLGITYAEAAERSMARLYGQIGSGKDIIVILTAFRSERPPGCASNPSECLTGDKLLAMNRDANRQLVMDIRGLGWGYTPVLGGFMEKLSTGGEKRVHEESFFITATGNQQKVVASVQKLVEKYDQDAALIKLPDNPQAMLLFRNGSTAPVGEWHADPTQMATYYTRMKGGPKGRQFKFEAAGNDSNMSRWAVDTWFKNK